MPEFQQILSRAESANSKEEILRLVEELSRIDF